MARRAVNNPLALAVLALLAEGPTHPYDMGRTLRERRKEESIKLNYGSLYAVVQQLQKAGFVAEGGVVKDAARPERTIYRLTEPGRVELHDWMAELVSTPHKEYRDFEAALALIGILTPAVAEGLLVLRLERLRAQREAMRAEVDGAVAGGLHPVFLVESEYRLALDEAEIRFVERLISQVRDREFIRPWLAFHQQQEDGTP